MSAEITIVKGTQIDTLRKKFDPDQHTIYDIKLAVNDELYPSIPIDKLVLKKKIKLQDDKKLSYYKIPGRFGTDTLTITTRLVGGAQYIPSHKVLNNKRNRMLDTTDPDIKLSQKQDCVYYTKDVPRAEMPCGHAFQPNTMFNLVKNVITKNEYGFDIKCPAANCGRVFDFDLVSKVADMNKEEYIYFDRELTRRSAPQSKACPNPKCDAECERPESLKIFRVRCTVCSFVDWCWLCKGKWLGGGFTLCGNKDCLSTQMNEDLQHSPMKKTTYKDSNDKYVQVPEMRACPKCLDYIEHSDACKHMTCISCGHEFCFSCLKGKVNGSWQCGDHRYQCVVAPRQKLN